MNYRLVYTKSASKDIKRLDATVKQRLGKSLEKYKNDPLRYAKKLSNPELGTYRFRVGDYRVIFDLDGENIVVLRVGHRRDIYRGI